MRTLKLIAGLGFFVLALGPGLIVLTDLHSFYGLPFAICAFLLGGVGWFLITRRNSSMSRNAKALIALTSFLCAGFVFAAVIPMFIKAIYTTSANACPNNLRLIDSAKQQWALEQNRKVGDIVTENDLKPYVGRGPDGEFPECPAGGAYIIGRVGEPPRCSVGTSAWPNDHVLSGGETGSWIDNWWTDFKAAYGTVLGLRHPLPQTIKTNGP